jgi:type II secretory pathway pseudopilin PulG
MKLFRQNRGFQLVEVMFTTMLISALGLIIYSILVTDTILGAKNSAMNTAHQQARTAMLQMLQDLHSSVALPYLVDANLNPTATSPAPGIAFQQWGSGTVANQSVPLPVFKIIQDTAALPTSQNYVQVTLPNSASPWPVVNQRLIIPSHQMEGDITAVSGTYNNLKITLANIAGPAPSPAPSPAGTKLPVQILGTLSTVGDIVCYATDRCSYAVANNALDWRGPTTHSTFSVMGSNITNSQGTIDPNNPPTPFSIPTTAAGALYYRFVAAVDLSTSDLKYNNRGYKSANILLNGQVPMKARLTTYTGAPTPTPTP